ncbi:MAG: hypothetical protein IPM57_10885 [Oligoflexia bacterium]|nr:hypothetical protein [Oligoflexia bacterium]
MKIFILIFTFFNLNALKEKWDINIQSENQADTMVVMDIIKKEEIFKFNATAEAPRFKEAEELYFKNKNKSILITRWSRGAHSEVIRVFDPLKKQNQLIKEIVTSWPASYKIQNNKLVFLIPVDKYDGTKPKNVKLEWDPFSSSGNQEVLKNQ